MASWKNISLAVSVLALSACATKFDPVEHGKIVDIHHRLQQAQTQNLCQDPGTARALAHELKRDVDWFAMYAQYIPNNENIEKMAKEMAKSADEFATRYNSGTTPSRIYCELKIKTLNSQIDIIQRTNARRPR